VHAAIFRFVGHQREVRLVGDGFGAYEVHLLEIGPVVAAGFQAVGFELRGDVDCGNLTPARARAASFQQIIGEKLDV
jgi:hypothetical protein